MVHDTYNNIEMRYITCLFFLKCPMLYTTSCRGSTLDLSYPAATSEARDPSSGCQRWRDNPAEIQVFTSKSGDFMIKHGCFQQKPGAPKDESGISMDFNGFSQAIVSFDDKLISDQWPPTWCREMIAVGFSNQAMTYRFHLNHHPIWQRNSSTKCGVRKPLNSWTYFQPTSFTILHP